MKNLNNSVNVSSEEKERLNRQLIEVSWGDELPAMKELIEKGADINATIGDGVTPLHIAAINDNADVINFLIGKGANTSVTEELTGDTPLHKAVKYICINAVKALIEAKVDLTAKDMEGNSPFYHSVHSNSAECVRLLFTADAEFNATDLSHNIFLSPLLYYQNNQKEAIETLKLLVACGVDPDWGQSRQSLEKIPEVKEFIDKYERLTDRLVTNITQKNTLTEDERKTLVMDFQRLILPEYVRRTGNYELNFSETMIHALSQQVAEVISPDVYKVDFTQREVMDRVFEHLVSSKQIHSKEVTQGLSVAFANSVNSKAVTIEEGMVSPLANPMTQVVSYLSTQDKINLGSLNRQTRKALTDALKKDISPEGIKRGGNNDEKGRFM